VESTEFCVNHPDQPAAAECVACGEALCVHCLYYTGEGRPLCEQHAEEAAIAGTTIYAPREIAEATVVGEPSAKKKRGKLYRGNQTDLLALVSVVLGVTSIAMCSGIGAYCLPVAAAVFALVAYAQSDRAYDPERTRKLSLLGMGGCALVALGIAALVALYLLFFASVFGQSGVYYIGP
jgi:hypothetical protein